jgi:uncharacterized membrane protein
MRDPADVQRVTEYALLAAGLAAGVSIVLTLAIHWWQGREWRTFEQEQEQEREAFLRWLNEEYPKR